ncbi:conserved hypothetical protein [Pediculus humanus corporis]|uniref:Sema domain-containing protein n=1 Tax=Pediculus humanus subsp. corporis TaxID=121224 RepID=E0VS20_PEDHC|nr:uncharacterized protein Phum_PHUM409760 [Pediculus humanus corporis]EEB16176.1 conserved hypothetical protein [Pediculus humanus corporis]
MDEVVIHQCFIENVNAIIHLFGSIQEFTCGKLYYRTFYLDEKRNSLYVGAMDKLFKLKLNSISHSSCERDSLSLEPSDVGNCVSKGKSEYFDCRNHVRVIQAIGDGSRFYVCGTNAHNPKDWVIYVSLNYLIFYLFIIFFFLKKFKFRVANTRKRNFIGAK